MSYFYKIKIKFTGSISVKTFFTYLQESLPFCKIKTKTFHFQVIQFLTNLKFCLFYCAINAL